MNFADYALQIPQKDAPAPEFATLATATVTAIVQTATLPSMLKLSCGLVSLEVNEKSSRDLLARTLACIKDVFPVCESVILRQDETGFLLLYKRLENGQYQCEYTGPKKPPVR